MSCGNTAYIIAYTWPYMHHAYVHAHDTYMFTVRELGEREYTTRVGVFRLLVFCLTLNMSSQSRIIRFAFIEHEDYLDEG